jgi:hypothetical protein
MVCSEGLRFRTGVDVLEFGRKTPANWASGYAACDTWVFVSPPIGGWVMRLSNQDHHWV